MIQSSVGSYIFSGGYPYLKSRSELFRDTMKNGTLEYMDGCEFKWEKHNPLLFLSISDFARGIGSDGASMPISVNCKVRFENHREFVDGTGATADGSGGPCVLRDNFMFGTPLLLAWFPRMSLALSPSASLVSSQNVSHSSALQLLSQTQ
jgi:hypothetical protein